MNRTNINKAIDQCKILWLAVNLLLGFVFIANRFKIGYENKGTCY